ncbi:sulfurtransferase [Candidatus Pacearchaeota archaeon]|nr:sulfurtransferase [Candidatus Pacearchaeota archaeon]
MIKKTKNDGHNEAILSKGREFLDSVEDDWNYVLPTDLKLDLIRGHKNFLLDTRKPQDYKKGHIKGSKNIFWLDVLKQNNLKKLPKDKRIIVCCYVGHTASQVLVLLRLLGYNVRVLKFGMGKSPAAGVPVAGWENYGFDVVKGNK